MRNKQSARILYYFFFEKSIKALKMEVSKMENRKDENGFIKYLIFFSVLILFNAAIHNTHYGYYAFVRCIICITSILIAFQAFKKNIDWAKVVFIIIAIIFNPLAPIYLSRNIWMPIDIIAAILFVFAIRIL